MDRRGFIRLLAGVMAIPAAVGRVFSSRGQPEIVRPSDFDSLPNNQLSAYWMQTTRVSHCSSLAYDDTIDEIMSPKGDPGVRLRWHERRKERCRERTAKLRRQRPLPLP